MAAEETPIVAPRDRPLDLVEGVRSLGRSSFFGEANMKRALGVRAAAHELRLAAGARLWEVGEDGSHFVLVVEGSVRCTAPDGRTFRCGAGRPSGGLDVVCARHVSQFASDGQAGASGGSSELRVARSTRGFLHNLSAGGTRGIHRVDSKQETGNPAPPSCSLSPSTSAGRATASGRQGRASPRAHPAGPTRSPARAPTNVFGDRVFTPRRPSRR
jgi:hypothetical protein